MVIHINQNIRLELIAERHATALFEAVDNNREHLAEFLPWVNNMQSVNDFANYIKHCQSLHEQKKEVSFVIISGETVIGRIGIHHINTHNKKGAIGYWLIKNAQGKGIIINSCKALIEYGFKNLDLHRIEIKAATHNLKSQAIAEKLKFKKEGVLRQAELVNNKFFDLVVYSMLSDEWIAETLKN